MSAPASAIPVSVRGFSKFYLAVRIAYRVGRAIQAGLNKVLSDTEKAALEGVLAAIQLFLALAPFPFQDNPTDPPPPGTLLPSRLAPGVFFDGSYIEAPANHPSRYVPQTPPTAAVDPASFLPELP